MKVAALLLLLAFDVKSLWQRMTRETNSHAASAKAQSAYEARRYPDAERDFQVARQLRPTPATAFNLGTAQIAGGKRVEGSATLAAALADPALKAAALYNRGNSALAAGAYDHAIRDYIDSLRLRPRSAAAKRNLEIARLRKEASEQSRSNPDKGGGGSDKKQPSSDDQKESNKPKEGEVPADSLLRAVQQQELEELSRMRRVRPQPRRVGW